MAEQEANEVQNMEEEEEDQILPGDVEDVYDGAGDMKISHRIRATGVYKNGYKFIYSQHPTTPSASHILASAHVRPGTCFNTQEDLAKAYGLRGAQRCPICHHSQIRSHWTDAERAAVVHEHGRKWQRNEARQKEQKDNESEDGDRQDQRGQAAGALRVDPGNNGRVQNRGQPAGRVDPIEEDGRSVPENRVEDGDQSPRQRMERIDGDQNDQQQVREGRAAGGHPGGDDPSEEDESHPSSGNSSIPPRHGAGVGRGAPAHVPHVAGIPIPRNLPADYYVPSVASTRQINKDLRDIAKNLGNDLMWKSTLVAHEWMDSIQMALEQTHIEAFHWIYILNLLIPYTSLYKNTQTWVKKNIVDPHLPWINAKILFIAHFGRADWTDGRQAALARCKQGSNESVQHYSDRYLSLSTEIGLQDNDKLNLSNYMNGLHKHIHRELIRLRTDRRVNGTANYDFTSLEDIVATAITLDVQLKALDDIHKQDDVKNQGRRAEDKKRKHDGADDKDKNKKPRHQDHKNGKWCKFHKSDTHNTKDCRNKAQPDASTAPTEVKKDAKPKKAAGNGGNGGGGSGKYVDKKVICYNCSEEGHYAKHCPKADKKKARSVSTNSEGMQDETMSVSSTSTQPGHSKAKRK